MNPVSTWSRLFTVLVLGWLAAGEATAACTSPVTTARFGLLLDDAEAAYARADAPAFGRAADSLVSGVACLGEVPDRALVARYHRLQGIRAFLQDESSRAEEAFAAARRLEPAAGLPSALVPERHPMQRTYQAIPLDAVAVVEVPAAAEGALVFDGAPSRDRPASVPTLFQWRAADGAVPATAYLWPADPLPAYPVGKAEPPRIRRTLLLTAAAGGAVALGLYVGAAGAAGVYENPATPRGDLDGLRTAMAALNGSAIGVAVAAGGTALVAFVVPIGP